MIYSRLFVPVILTLGSASSTPFVIEESGSYLLQTATAAIKASENVIEVVDVDRSTTSTTTTPAWNSGAGIVGIKLNGKGDFPAFWAGLMTNCVMLVGCYIAFLILRKVYPMMYQANQDSFDKLKDGPHRMGDGLLAPVWAALGPSIDDVVEMVGLDHGMLLEFSNFVMKLFLFLGVPALMVLSPLYAFSGGHAANSRLSTIGFANVRENSLVCYPVAFFVWYAVIVTQVYIFRVQETCFMHRRKAWLMRMPMPRSQTVLVESIPFEYQNAASVTQFFEEIFGAGCLKQVSFIRQSSTLLSCITARNYCSQDLHEAEFAWDKEGAVDTDRQSLLEKKLAEAVAKVEEERKKILSSDEDMCGAAFVTFKDQKQSIMALNMRYTADDEEFVVSVPPDPSDVRYADLQLDPRHVAASSLIGYGLIAGIFFGFIPIVAGITNLTTLESVCKIGFLNDFFGRNPSLAAMWEGLASTLGLTIFMSFLPTFLVMIFSACFTMKANAWEQHHIQQWYFYFLVVYVLLVTAVGTSLWDRFKELVESPTSILQLIAQTLPAASHFYLNYVPLQWGTHGMNMLRYVNLFKFLGFRKVCSEDTARIKAEPEDQDYYGMGSRSARHTLIAVTGLVFCTLSPLITVLCFINGAVCRFLYGYLFVYAETKKADLGGVFWMTQMRHMQQGLLIYIALMTGVLLERANSIVPSVIAGSSAVLWLYSYRRFNHAFHLENLPLRDIKGAAAVEKRETSKLDYVQPELVAHEDSPRARKTK
ncbi:Uncharacterized protein RSN1 (Rescuer of SRO7 at high Nacl protein 1) [Durusdinium trenchii]|uniref:Uncharacterized protein RSN1 (Rescuer of SRO7 at high Nacl protein 1) n=1 Tax=Durusdinium trenchii TaxID=1381693 RepID=A0ABP0I7B8_9DINO